MTPYAAFLRNTFVKLIVRLPFSVLLELYNKEFVADQSLDEDKLDERSEVLKRSATELITNRKTFQSKYVKQIFKSVKSQLPKIISEYRSAAIEGKTDDIEKTIKLIGQLLTLNEINDFIADFTAFVDDATAFLSGIEHNTESKEYQELASYLKQIALKCASPSKSLNDLLTELPFQVFYLIADADDVVDMKERAGFQKILKDREWCSGDFSHLCFAKTEFSYDELYSKLTGKSLKTSMNEVKRTLRITDQLFTVKEVNLLKIDLYRLAKDIAKASGGIGSIGAISRQEKEVLDVLEKHLGDIAAMQLSTAARQSDQVAKLIGSEEEKRAADKMAESAAAGKDTQKAVVIHEPPLKVLVKIADREIPATALNLSRKGIQCLLEFEDIYVDTGKGASLQLALYFEDEELILDDIRCKTIKSTIRKWNTKLTPLQLILDWGFYKLETSQQEAIERFIEIHAANTHPAS